MRSERVVAGWTATGAAASLALIAVVDPNRPGRYPTCPTRLLTGFDCPACGTLRGLHALSTGDVTGALDHNLLLMLAVPLAAWWWFRFARLAVTGEPSARVRWPRWALPALVVVATTFTVLRNLPISGLTWLDAA